MLSLDTLTTNLAVGGLNPFRRATWKPLSRVGRRGGDLVGDLNVNAPHNNGRQTAGLYILFDFPGVVLFEF